MPSRKPQPRLFDAWKAVGDAMKVVADVWETDPEARTPRLADIVSLLDRARSKLWKECKGANVQQPREEP